MSCGINLILLRGLGREAEHWLGFDRLLQEVCERYPEVDRCSVLTPDIPGCGRALQRSTPWRLQAISEVLLRQLPNKTQGCRQVIIGLSMGGMIALDIAQRYPELTDGVVLINSSTASQKPWLRIKPLAMLQSLFSLISPWRLREITMLALVSNRKSDVVKQSWLSIQQQRPVARYNLLAMLWAASRFKLHSRPRAPGLVVAGMGDRMVHPVCSKALAEQLAWPLCTHPSAGHDLPLDEPEWLAECIAEWLASKVI